MSTPAFATAFPLADADLCVKCGLCLPHCPSYLDTRNEADSPRGRIALMQALASAAIAQTARVEAHLDACLGCRACERVCPASVPYGALIDAGRSLMAARNPSRLRMTRMLSAVLSTRGMRLTIRQLLRLSHGLGITRTLHRFARTSSSTRWPYLRRWLSLLPDVPGRPREAAATRVAMMKTSRGKVALFTGCVGDIAEAEVADDLARLLAACGFEVEIPKSQTCCGALDQHAGRPTAATHLVGRNLAAFKLADNRESPILSLATGCAATLLDYPRLAASPSDGKAFAKRLRDPLDFLLENGDALRFRALSMRVAIHEPCTQTNVIRRGGALRKMLARIPDIELIELVEPDSTTRCCGAAGSYFVTEPDSADRLLQPKLDAAQKLAPQIIVSANVGCSLHIAAGLRRAGLNVALVHPVTLLARQMS